MKKDTHPEYFENAKLICACGTTHEIGSTVAEIRIELCSNCHPFYTGKQKIIDTARRVEKFQTRLGKKSDSTLTKKDKRAKRDAKRQEKQKQDQ